MWETFDLFGVVSTLTMYNLINANTLVQKKIKETVKYFAANTKLLGRELRLHDEFEQCKDLT